jgi:hypothetical protein
MPIKVATMKRLKAAAAKAAARAAAAKEKVRSAKALLKPARKGFKVEKKAAKQARKKVDAAAAVSLDRAVKPVAVAKPAAAPKPLEVAKRAAAPKPAGVRKPATAPKPARRTSRGVPKARVRKSPETMRSAAEVAKSVIERLHSPPPALPPTPMIAEDPTDPAVAAPVKT